MTLFQMQGYLMWHSLTPKVIHVNQRWMVITDDKKVGNKTLDKTLSVHLTPPPPFPHLSILLLR